MDQPILHNMVMPILHNGRIIGLCRLTIRDELLHRGAPYRVALEEPLPPLKCPAHNYTTDVTIATVTIELLKRLTDHGTFADWWAISIGDDLVDKVTKFPGWQEYKGRQPERLPERKA